MLLLILFFRVSFMTSFYVLSLISFSERLKRLSLSIQMLYCGRIINSLKEIALKVSLLFCIRNDVPKLLAATT